MKIGARAMTTSIVLAALVAAAVPAQSRPHDRNGFFLGFGFGGGGAWWDWADTDAGDNASEGSGTLNIRVGGAIRDDLVLGAELQAWSKGWTLASGTGVDLGDLTISLGTLTFAATWFPGNLGVFLRGGVGLASARTEVSTEAGGLVISGTNTDTGIGLLGASGYEWRVTDKFAIGPQVEVAYLGIDGDLIRDPVVLDVSVQFNWYW
jgi:hypothetical protein